MAKTAKIAWRNLGRNRRRTLITGSALALSTALCIAAYGLTDGMNVEMLRVLTRYDLGHVQAHHAEYRERPTLKRTLPRADAVVAALRKDARVAYVARRVLSFGLVSRADKSTGVQIIGVQPKRERKISGIDASRVSGTFLPDDKTPWPPRGALSQAEKKKDEELTKKAEDDVLGELDALSGIGSGKGTGAGAGTGAGTAAKRGTGAGVRGETRKLADKLSPPPARPPDVYLGVGLAKRLAVKVGSKLELLAYAVDGTSEQVTVNVVGLYRTGTSQYDTGRLYMHIADVQRLSHLGTRVHQVTALVKDVDTARDVAKAARVALGVSDIKAVKKNPSSAPLVQSWNESRPDIENMLKLNEGSIVLIMLFIYLVAALGVINTMLMSVLERTREIGVLKAIGMRGSGVLRMIVTETTALAVISAVIGAGLGLLLNAYLARYGIDLSSSSESFTLGGVGFKPVFKAVITARGTLVPVVVLTISCCLASLYPAIRAALLAPAAGMREL